MADVTFKLTLAEAVSVKEAVEHMVQEITSGLQEDMKNGTKLDEKVVMHLDNLKSAIRKMG